jgi:hypothetical protein
VLDATQTAVADALDGRLPVRDHPLAPSSAVAAPGLALHLHPALR